MYLKSRLTMITILTFLSLTIVPCCSRPKPSQLHSSPEIPSECIRSRDVPDGSSIGHRIRIMQRAVDALNDCEIKYAYPYDEAKEKLIDSLTQKATAQRAEIESQIAKKNICIEEIKRLNEFSKGKYLKAGKTLKSLMVEYYNVIKPLALNTQREMLHIIHLASETEDRTELYSLIERNRANVLDVRLPALLTTAFNLGVIEIKKLKLVYENSVREVVSCNASEVDSLTFDFKETLLTIDNAKAAIRIFQKNIWDKSKDVDQKLQAKIDQITRNLQDLASREALKESIQLSSSAQFLGQINGMVDAAFKAKYPSPNPLLPYLGKKRDALLGYLNFDKYCTSIHQRLSYMETGCLRSDMFRVNARAKDKAFFRLRMETGLLVHEDQYPSMSVSQIRDIRDLLNQNKILSAIRQYDYLLSLGGV